MTVKLYRKPRRGETTIYHARVTRIEPSNTAPYLRVYTDDPHRDRDDYMIYHPEGLDRAASGEWRGMVKPEEELRAKQAEGIPDPVGKGEVAKSDGPLMDTRMLGPVRHDPDWNIGRPGYGERKK